MRLYRTLRSKKTVKEYQETSYRLSTYDILKKVVMLVCYFEERKSQFARYSPISFSVKCVYDVYLPF
jgi:hypothetical protein